MRKVGVNPPKGSVVYSRKGKGSFNFGWRGEFKARESLDRVNNQHPAFA